VQETLQSFEAAGVRPVAISVDSPDQSRDLRSKAGYTFTFLADPDAGAIRRYDLLDRGQGIDGHDVARPAEFLIDRTGTVRWRNLTGDYRVRARPAEMLAAAEKLR